MLDLLMDDTMHKLPISSLKVPLPIPASCHTSFLYNMYGPHLHEGHLSCTLISMIILLACWRSCFMATYCNKIYYTPVYDYGLSSHCLQCVLCNVTVHPTQNTALL